MCPQKKVGLGWGRGREAWGVGAAGTWPCPWVVSGLGDCPVSPRPAVGPSGWPCSASALYRTSGLHLKALVFLLARNWNQVSTWLCPVGFWKCRHTLVPWSCNQGRGNPWAWARLG